MYRSMHGHVLLRLYQNKAPHLGFQIFIKQKKENVLFICVEIIFYSDMWIDMYTVARLSLVSWNGMVWN